MRLSTEINDFLNAWGKTDKILGSKDDREYKRLRNEIAKQKLATDPQVSAAKLKYYGLKQGNVAAATDLIRGRLKKLNSPVAAPATGDITNEIPVDTGGSYTPRAVPFGDDTPASPSGTVPGKQSGDTYVPAELTALDDDDEDGAQVPQFAARGGSIKPARVQKFATGGAVDTDGSEEPAGNIAAVPDDDDQEDTSVMEGAPETGADGDTRVADASGTIGASGPGFSYQAAHDAVRDGMAYSLKEAQLHEPVGVEDDTRTHRRSQRLRGAGAAPRVQMEQLQKRIDPEGKMSEPERVMASFGTVYDYFLRKGNQEGAERAAGQMLQYYRAMHNRYRALAQVAAENGDVNGAMRNVLKAYANVPDGMDIHMVKQGEKVGYTFTDQQTGKTMFQQLVSPDELLNRVTRGAIPGFDDLIVQSAGRRYQNSRQGASSRPSRGGVGSPTDLSARAKASEAIGEEAGAQDMVDNAPKARYSLPAGDESGVKDIAASIYRSNELSPHDAMRVATGLVDPSKPNDMLQPTEDGGGVVKLGDGREVKLPRNAFLQAVAIRGKAVKSKTTKEAVGTKRAEEDKAAVDLARQRWEKQRRMKDQRGAAPVTGTTSDDFIRRGAVE